MEVSATAKSVSSYASTISRHSFGFGSEDSGDKECYICLRSHAADDLIWPCICRTNGSPRWVHRQCLDRWRRNAADPRYITECRDCRFRFRFVALQVSQDDILDKKRRRKKAIYTMLRNFFISFAILQFGLAFSALLVYAGDRTRALPEYIFNDTEAESAPFISVYMAYYVLVCLSFLFVFGIKIIFVWAFKCCRPNRRRRAPEENKDSCALWCPEWMVCEYCDSWWFAMSPICTEICLHCCNPETLECRECGTACSEGSSDVCRCISCGHCAGLSCDCNLSGEIEEMLMAMAVVIVVFVIFGAVICIVGLIASVLMIFAYFRRIWQHYVELVVIRDLTQEFIVADLSVHLPQPRPSATSLKDNNSVKAFSEPPATPPEAQTMREQARTEVEAKAPEVETMPQQADTPPPTAPAQPNAVEQEATAPEAQTMHEPVTSEAKEMPSQGSAPACASQRTSRDLSQAPPLRLSRTRTYTRQFSSQRTTQSFNPELLAPVPASEKERALQELARDVIQEIRPFRASRRVKPLTIS